MNLEKVEVDVEVKQEGEMLPSQEGESREKTAGASRKENYIMEEGGGDVSGLRKEVEDRTQEVRSLLIIAIISSLVTGGL